MINTKTITLSIITAATLLAAPPSAGDIEKQIVIPKAVQEKEGVNNAIPEFVPKVQTQESVKENVDFQKVPTVHITKITYEGNEHMAKESLDELLKSHLGKAYTFEELKKMTSIVTKHYREQGYFVARAYLSQNAIEGETFKISIIEGAYGEFKLSNTSLVNDEHIKEMLEDVAQDKIISVSTIERAMLLINDTPGAKVTKADIMPGQFVGSSDFAITTESTNPYSAYILGDNYGSQYTGKYRVNLGLSANSPLGYGDKLSLNGLLSTTGDLKNGRIAYGFPLMSNGLRGELSASKTTYSLAKEYEVLDAIGNATSLEAKLSYPLIRTRQETLNLSIGFAHKKMEDEVRSTSTLINKDSDALSLGANYFKNCILFGLQSTTSASVTLTAGKLDSPSNKDTDGSFSKIEGSLEKALQFNAEYSLTASLRFQKALKDKNLDGSEDFSLGGAYGVRAFPDGEHSAENGYILGVELFYTLPSYEGINHKVSIFADTGYASMQNYNGTVEGRQLFDMGLGYQASYKDFFAKAQIARVMGGEKSETEDKDSTRFLLQLGWIY